MDIMQEAGGLHRFMNWDLPILTDSGVSGIQSQNQQVIRKAWPQVTLGRIDSVSKPMRPWLSNDNWDLISPWPLTSVRPMMRQREK